MNKFDAIFLVYNVFVNRVRAKKTIIHSKDLSEIYSFSERFLTEYPVYKKSISYDMFSHFLHASQNVIKYLKKRQIDQSSVLNKNAQ